MAQPLYVVVGLGKSGFSAAKYLLQQGHPVAITDNRVAPPLLDAFKAKFPEVNISLGAFDQALLDQGDVIVVSPGVSLQEPQIARQSAQGKSVIGDIELFARNVTAPVIAITGTNAKSTVTTLVGEMAKAAGRHVRVGGNLGEPALDLLQDTPPDLFVLEISSFQLETTSSLRPAVATILNITEDHLDRYADFAAYCRAKQQIYTNCEIAVCNRDDILTECVSPVPRKYYFSLGVPAFEEQFGLLEERGEIYLARGRECLLPVRALQMVGKHSYANALAALAIGHAAGFSMEAMLRTLTHFAGLPHRCQLVREHAGVRWYNDSKGTNVGATLAALYGLGAVSAEKFVLIAGGIGKNADFSPLLPVMEQYVKKVILIGEAAAELEVLMTGRIPFQHAKSMEEAVSLAAQAVQPNESVLLSPACASFDMFRDFAHRGQVFTDCVHAL